MAASTEERTTLFRGDEKVLSTLKTDTPDVPAMRQPPPEKPESTRTRTLVVLSFWAVVLCLGLPVWLWTTSIHRAHLPLREMLDWADGKVC